MCSIFGVLELKTNPIELRSKAIECSRMMRHRGPDWSGIYADNYIILVHERLSIIDIDNGAQPLYNVDHTNVLAVNGEIYNHHKLREKLQINYMFQTASDCEIILALYQQNGINFLDDLEGMFAFILWDNVQHQYLIARDHIGIIPLYMGNDIHGNLYVASEMKALVTVCNTVKEFPPGSYLFSKYGKIYNYWQRDWMHYSAIKDNSTDYSILKIALEESVKNHLMSDVPYGVLLSGGLDSSIIAAITKRFFIQRINKDKNKHSTFHPYLHSFAIGLRESPDLKAAKLVAQHLETLHHEVHFTIQEGINIIRDVIYHVETYDVTTIRASIPMYLISHKIKTTGIKMVLSGEGADEIFGGYLYFHKAPNAREFHEENVRKLLSLHMYDCARVNKAMSAWGIEARVPFLDKKFLDVAMRINPKDKMCGNNGKIEKYLLRKSFSSYLPNNITWRQKEQFSDGVGYEWINGLKDIASKLISDQKLTNSSFRFPYNTPHSKEAYLYREIFEELFPIPNAVKCIPGGQSIACSSDKVINWDNTFKNMDDPSGRTVNVHNYTYTK
ncbi:asparagine synthase B [Pantoea sp. Mhis]|uniref:asparagine synthase B n=1 Tax=Pantoea sp. Mhis TaxID=2576759 RepID=UPI00135BE171|nr:asparagine synthase B [Pantoea sp. Mhis]MXP56276.1 asparagine synthase B [Pantoea sp. Mhis]